MSKEPGLRGVPALLGSVVMLITLSGCASGLTPTPAVFDREQNAEDQLPAEATNVGPVESTSTRLLWADSGVSFFAAKSLEDPDGKCIVVVEDSPDDYPTYCSTNLPIILEIQEGTFALGDEAPKSTGWEQIADSFWRASGA